MKPFMIPPELTPEIQDEFLPPKGIGKILVYGGAGVGKTTGVLENLTGKKCYISFDPGSIESPIVQYHIEQGMEVLDYENPTSTGILEPLPASNLDRFARDLQKRSREKYFEQFDALILDSMTSLQSVLVGWSLQNTAQHTDKRALAPTVPVYGTIAVLQYNLIRQMLTLVPTVVIIAHERVERVTKGPMGQQTTDEYYDIGVEGQKLLTTLPTLFSEIYYVTAYTIGAKFTQKVQIVPSQFVRTAKSRIASVLPITPQDNLQSAFRKLKTYYYLNQTGGIAG